MNMIVRGFAAAMLVIQTASVIEARAQSDENNIDTEVYIILRTAIAERLATALDSAAVNPTDVRKFAEDALNEKWSSLRATFPFSGEGKLAEAENVVAIVRNHIIQNIGTNRLEKGDFQTARDAVDAYLTNVLDESLDFTGTRLTGTNALSDYHTLVDFLGSSGIRHCCTAVRGSGILQEQAVGLSQGNGRHPKVASDR